MRGEIEWLGNRIVKWGRGRVMELQRQKIYESLAAVRDEERGTFAIYFSQGTSRTGISKKLTNNDGPKVSEKIFSLA